MRILVVGASGTLGKAVSALLGQKHQIIGASRNDALHPVDLTRNDSVEALFAKVGMVDAIVATTGTVYFGPLGTMSAGQFDSGLQDKLLGQVRLALIGQHFINDGGSITLTSGILSEQPIGHGANATAVNAGLEGFVRGAACELPRSIRINAVSPTVLEESWGDYASFFPGFVPVPAARVALAYQRSIEGVQNAQIFKVW